MHLLNDATSHVRSLNRAAQRIELSSLGKESVCITLQAAGPMIKTALELANQGMGADVWSVPFIKPLNRQQPGEITRCVDCVITLEEHSVTGGLGACVAEEVVAHRPLPVCRIDIEDRFSAYCGTWDYLLQEHRLDLLSVKQHVNNFVANLLNNKQLP